MRRLHSIAAIKHAVVNGFDVRCNGGGYKVIRDTIGQFLIVCNSTDYCVGLHGAENTRYGDHLNGRDFYVRAARTETVDEQAARAPGSACNKCGDIVRLCAARSYCREDPIRKSQAMPREHAIETALSWANQQGYSNSYVALDTYCKPRGLSWEADPMHAYIKYTEQGATS